MFQGPFPASRRFGAVAAPTSCRFSDSAATLALPSPAGRAPPIMRGMSSSLELLQRRERLRVGERFLRLRPKLATLGALGNAGFLALSSAPPLQKLALAAAFAGTVGAFWLEAWWLGRRRLTERWLLWSLAATLGALSGGALFSGGLTSPVLPLLFAPVVVGFAAFARARVSAVLWLGALAALLLLYAFAPLA